MGMENSAKSTLCKTLSKFASPAILFYALPWLMALLVIGTYLQKDLGLYTAQKMFFGSWIIWLGPLPLPGGYATLAIITVCLLAKFLFKSPWRAGQAGINITHLSVLVLLIGSGVTAETQSEGFLSIKEGQSGNAVSDYHARQILVYKDGAQITAVDFDALQKGDIIGKDILPFTAKIESLCRNCRPVPVKDTTGRHGLAEQISLASAPEEKENEANLSGFMLLVNGLGEEDGIYAAMEEIPHRPEIEHKDATYNFAIMREQHVLPFEIELKDFKRDLHPGTDMARGFSSDVIVKDNGTEWPAVISMNEPLRYKGYTFYQASFSIRPDGEFSVLSVVQNKGRVFPYIAGALLMVGLILHIVLRLKGCNAW